MPKFFVWIAGVGGRAWPQIWLDDIPNRFTVLQKHKLTDEEKSLTISQLEARYPYKAPVNEPSA